MDTKLITDSDNVEPIAKKKSTGKKEKVIIVPPNPEKDPNRKKEYDETLKYIQTHSVRMLNDEFKALRSGSRFSWIETIDVHQCIINGKFHSIDDSDREQAVLCVFHYDAKDPGFIHRSLYLHSDGKLFKPSDIEEVNKIVKHLKDAWLYRFERSLTWEAEAKIWRANHEKEQAEKKAQREAKAKLKAGAGKNKPGKKTKLLTDKTAVA